MSKVVEDTKKRGRRLSQRAIDSQLCISLGYISPLSETRALNNHLHFPKSFRPLYTSACEGNQSARSKILNLQAQVVPVGRVRSQCLHSTQLNKSDIIIPSQHTSSSGSASPSSSASPTRCWPRASSIVSASRGSSLRAGRGEGTSSSGRRGEVGCAG